MGRGVRVTILICDTLYVLIGFDTEVQPLVTHNAALPLC